ncbi:hypothetical protein HZS_2493 [Henneguya salminicola]|nr:hypothetical protein HZS_2493 [Henneguya salminicola]
MTVIFTIIRISLILSCIDNVHCGQDASSNFQYNYASSLNLKHHTPIDVESIIQSSTPIFYDISVVVTKNAVYFFLYDECAFCETEVPNITRYLELLFQSASAVIYFFVILNMFNK